jgi:peptidoglycan/xylan/chitin deacetylase (PgdA/CDA1 family)
VASKAAFSKLKWKQAVQSSLTSLAHYGGLLDLFRYFTNSLKLKRDANGRSVFPYVTARPERNFQILTFHRLSLQHDPFFPGLPANLFEQQIKYLMRHHLLCDLGSLLKKLDAGEPVPDNAVAITFDDGYRDNYDLALPILQKYGASATIFLTTGFVDHQDIPWNDKICFALKHSSRSGVEFVTDRRSYFSLKSVEGRLQAVDEILWFLRRIPHIQKTERMNSLLSELGVNDFGTLSDSMLTWNQVSEMNKAGITFGAHTISHPILSRIPLETARKEVTDSKTIIESRLQRKIDLFAYPSGTSQDYTEDIKKLLSETGFRAAVTTVFGTNTPETDPFELRRCWMIDESALGSFAAKLLWYKFSS